MAIGAPRGLGRVDKAIAWFRERTTINDEAFESLLESAGQKALTISEYAQLNMVSRILKEAKKSERKGESIDDFRKRMSRRLRREWGTSNPSALITIWRTELQKEHQRGRYFQLTKQSVKNLRPFWIFDAILDSRTSAICNARHGEIRHVDDQWWQSNYPPLHFNCRSGVRALRRSDVAKFGDIQPRTFPNDVDPGFGRTPDAGDLGEYKPDLGDIDDELRQDFEQRTGQ